MYKHVNHANGIFTGAQFGGVLGRVRAFAQHRISGLSNETSGRQGDVSTFPSRLIVDVELTIRAGCA